VSATASNTEWTTNASVAQIAGIVRDASSILLLTHAKPDGDAIGSTLSLARTLASMGVKHSLVYLGPWSARFDGVLGETPVIHADENTFTEPPFDEPGMIVVMDTGSRSQLAEASDYVEARAEKTIILDHHAHGDAQLAHTRHIDISAAAACLIGAELVSNLLSVPVSKLPREVAEPLFLGCATDTGWFKHPNVTPRCLRTCADLLEAGANHDELFRTTEQNDPPARLLLMQRALDSLEFFDDRRVAVMALTMADFDETGANPDDSGGLIDLPKTVGVVRVSALLTEAPGVTKVSFRSKAGEGEVDVNLVAQSLGGGGHKHAAGAKIKAPLTEARAKVIEALGGSA